MAATTLFQSVSHRLLQLVGETAYDDDYNQTMQNTLGGGGALHHQNDNVFDSIYNNNNDTDSNTTDFLSGVANVLSGDDSHPSASSSFDPKVFWSVNAFILVLFCTTVLWCCFGDKSLFTLNPEERRQRSDELYRRRILERRQQEEEAKQETPAQRTKKLLKSFAKHQVQMTVKAEDLVEEDPYDTVKLESDNSVDDIETGSMEDCGQLKLTNGNLVPNCCAICLTSYEEGDQVIWSSNKECAHAFHQDCVVGWLVKMQPETPCPCCRQEFTDLENVRKENKVKWSANAAFNFGALSLR